MKDTLITTHLFKVNEILRQYFIRYSIPLFWATLTAINVGR